MNEIRITALLRVAGGKLEAFKKHCDALTAKVRAEESGDTLIYSFYLDQSDPTTCLAQEIYANAEAFSRHVNNMATMGQMGADLFTIERCDICGELSPDQVSAMRDYANAANITYTNFNALTAKI